MERIAAERPASAGPVALDRALLDRAADRLFQFMDTDRGGTRGAPKFPQASLLELFWRAGLRTGDARYRDIVLVTLRGLANGGIYDHVGGGFARYSVDERWLVPHFEKMLYDNAQLIELMTYAWIGTGEKLFADRVEETIAWLTREMLLDGGAFAASLDADSEGHEGKFYVWTRAEVLDALGAEEGAFFADVYDITDGGNWEGVSIPNRLQRPERLSAEDEARLTRTRTGLLARRAGRVRPGTDDKVLADWNGLAIAALAFAGSTFRRADWLALAEGAYRFVTATMMGEDRLAHAWRDGKSVYPGLATDYAAMAKAALALHAATFDAAYIRDARRLVASAGAHHWDSSEPGYFLSADDAEALIVRPRSATDEATPSATSVMASNLVRLWRLTGEDSYRATVDSIMDASGPAVAANLFASAGLLNALDLRLGVTDLVIVTPAGVSANALLELARQRMTPNVSLSTYSGAVSLPGGHPAAGKTAAEGKATAYFCRGESCSLPVTSPEALAAVLG
jgi:uncharacterized protein YyaL (SSP411 family)